MATSTATRNANRTAVRNARPGTKPPIHIDAKPAVPSVLDGVTAPPKETARTKAARALAEATANAKNPFEAAAITKGPLANGAKAAKAPKVNVNEIKNDLAALIVRAAGDAIESLGAEDPIRALGTTEAIATLASRWLHYLPVGATWPEGFLPVPPRSEWNADGTRV